MFHTKQISDPKVQIVDNDNLRFSEYPMLMELLAKQEACCASHLTVGFFIGSKFLTKNYKDSANISPSRDYLLSWRPAVQVI